MVERAGACATAETSVGEHQTTNSLLHPPPKCQAFLQLSKYQCLQLWGFHHASDADSADLKMLTDSATRLVGLWIEPQVTAQSLLLSPLHRSGTHFHSWWVKPHMHQALLV